MTREEAELILSQTKNKVEKLRMNYEEGKKYLEEIEKKLQPFLSELNKEIK